MKHIFRGVKLCGVLASRAGGQFFGVLKCSADVTRELCDAMAWDTVYKEDGSWTHGSDKMKLVGSIVTEKLALVLNDGENVRIELQASEAKSFWLIRKENLVSLSFNVVVPWDSVVPALAHWFLYAEADHAMTLSTAQGELPFGEPEPAAEGVEPEERPGAPALGSALQVVGGGSMDQLKKKRQARRRGERVPSGAVVSEAGEE